jgi:hypothetical protein
VRRPYRPKTPEGAADGSYVHFLFGLIFKYEATTEKGHRSQGPNDTTPRAGHEAEVPALLAYVGRRWKTGQHMFTASFSHFEPAADIDRIKIPQRSRSLP